MPRGGTCNGVGVVCKGASGDDDELLFSSFKRGDDNLLCRLTINRFMAVMAAVAIDYCSLVVRWYCMRTVGTVWWYHCPSLLQRRTKGCRNEVAFAMVWHKRRGRTGSTISLLIFSYKQHLWQLCWCCMYGTLGYVWPCPAMVSCNKVVVRSKAHYCHSYFNSDQRLARGTRWSGLWPMAFVQDWMEREIFFLRKAASAGAIESRPHLLFCLFIFSKSERITSRRLVNRPRFSPACSRPAVARTSQSCRGQSISFNGMVLEHPVTKIGQSMATRRFERLARYLPPTHLFHRSTSPSTLAQHAHVDQLPR